MGEKSPTFNGGSMEIDASSSSAPPSPTSSQGLIEFTTETSPRVCSAVRDCFSWIGNWAMDHPRTTMYFTSACILGIGVGINHLPVSDVVRNTLSAPFYIGGAVLAGIATFRNEGEQ